MPSRGRKSKAVPFSAADVANVTKANPYIQRLAQDAKLRSNVRTAFDSTKSAYARLSNGMAPRSMLQDKKLQRDLGEALVALRDATIALTEAPRKRARRRLTFGRKLLLVGIGSGIALAASESLRSKVLDTLFGAEEEFEYTPPASTASSETSQTVGAA